MIAAKRATLYYPQTIQSKDAMVHVVALTMGALSCLPVKKFVGSHSIGCRAAADRLVLLALIRVMSQLVQVHCSRLTAPR